VAIPKVMGILKKMEEYMRISCIAFTLFGLMFLLFFFLAKFLYYPYNFISVAPCAASFVFFYYGFINIFFPENEK
jgi:hypothetical protein